LHCQQSSDNLENFAKNMQRARRNRERKQRNKMSVNVDCQDNKMKAETFFALAKRRLDKYFFVLNSRSPFVLLFN